MAKKIPLNNEYAAEWISIRGEPHLHVFPYFEFDGEIRKHNQGGVVLDQNAVHKLRRIMFFDGSLESTYDILSEVPC